MKRRKSFTLAELLTTIALSAILFLAVGTALYMFSSLNESALSSSKVNYQIMTLKETIIQNDLIDETLFYYDGESKELSYEEEFVMFIENVEDIHITQENGFYNAEISYKDGNVIRILCFVIREV